MHRRLNNYSIKKGATDGGTLSVSGIVKEKFQHSILVIQYFFCELGFINDEEKRRRGGQLEGG